MKQPHILLYFISLLVGLSSYSQQKTDTLKKTDSYSIRVGIDISKPITTIFEPDTKGFEIVGDIKFKRNLYVAAEFGFDEKTTQEDYLNFTTKGSYAKIGINYNAYKNWVGMDNEIYVGVRYGFSFFNQTLNNYTPNATGTFFTPETLAPNSEFKDLTAHWAEFVFGLKVETFKNLYLGASFNVKKIINTKEPENFKNLQIPGFNRVYLNNMGVGFNYTISYLIPIIIKKK